MTLRRSALTRSTPLRSSSRLRPFSRKRAAARSTRAAVREAVFERDGHTCRLLALVGHRCVGPLTPHHIRKEAQGGVYSAENLIAVCAGGNSAIETMQTKPEYPDGKPRVFFKPPVGMPGVASVAFPPHSYRECADGSLEIRASILIHGRAEGDPHAWHGYLDEGHVWRTV